MLEGLIHDAKSAAGAVLSKYAARGSVAVPFAIALGFGTAGATLLLVERFGAYTAFFILAAAFCVIGVIGALVVSDQERREVRVEAQATKAAEAETATNAAANGVAAVEQLPLALIGALFTGPTGHENIQKAARIIGRNAPLLLILAAVALLMWPKRAVPASPQAQAIPGGDAPRPAANGHDAEREVHHAAAPIDPGHQDRSPA